MKRRSGFTLIELLVVIAIIAILASILFPVFAKAREKARQSRCVSNIKQLTMAVQQYADDNDEVLPPNHVYAPSTNYPNAILTYVKDYAVFLCSSHEQRLVLPGATGSLDGFSSYGMNDNLTYTANGTFDPFFDPEQGRALSDIQYPSELILLVENSSFADSNPSVYVPVGSTLAWFDINSATYNPWRSTNRPYGHVYPLHSGGCVTSFCDGHAKWMPVDKLANPPGGSITDWRLWFVSAG